MKSIAMPSHRSRVDSLKAISGARWYADDTKSELKVADNSDDPTKNWTAKCCFKSTATSMLDNFRAAFDATTGDYVLLMGDDDQILSLYPTGIPDSKPAGIMPTIQFYSDPCGITQVTAGQNLEVTAAARLSLHNKQYAGGNPLMFCFWRRDLLGSVLDLWQHHPIGSAASDFAVVNALVSSGPIARDTGTVYFKDISNWIGTQEQIDAEIARLYTSVGAHAGLAKHNALINRLDSFIMILRKDSPLSEQEKVEAANIYKPDFLQAGSLLEEFGLLDKYIAYYRKATGREWGSA